MKHLTLAVLVALSALSVSMFSMQEAHAERGTIGFGTSVDLRFGNTVGLGNILVPIHLNEKFVIEPEFGVLHTSETDNNSFDQEGEAIENTESTLSLRLGSGFLYKSAINKNVNIYGGLRLGINYMSSNDENEVRTSKSTRTDLWVGGVTGLSLIHI